METGLNSRDMMGEKVEKRNRYMNICCEKQINAFDHMINSIFVPINGYSQPSSAYIGLKHMKFNRSSFITEPQAKYVDSLKPYYAPSVEATGGIQELHKNNEGIMVLAEYETDDDVLSSANVDITRKRLTDLKLNTSLAKKIVIDFEVQCQMATSKDIRTAIREDMSIMKAVNMLWFFEKCAKTQLRSPCANVSIADFWMMVLYGYVLNMTKNSDQQSTSGRLPGSCFMNSSLLTYSNVLMNTVDVKRSTETCIRPTKHIVHNFFETTQVLSRTPTTKTILVAMGVAPSGFTTDSKFVSSIRMEGTFYVPLTQSSMIGQKSLNNMCILRVDGNYARERTGANTVVLPLAAKLFAKQLEESGFFSTA